MVDAALYSHLQRNKIKIKSPLSIKTVHYYTLIKMCQSLGFKKAFFGCGGTTLWLTSFSLTPGDESFPCSLFLANLLFMLSTKLPYLLKRKNGFTSKLTAK